MSETKATAIESVFLGEWATARMRFLQNQRPEYWQKMIEQGTARQYLENYQEEYRMKFNQIQNQLMKTNRIPESQPEEMSWLEYLNLITMVAETARELTLKEIYEMDQSLKTFPLPNSILQPICQPQLAKGQSLI